MNEKILKSDQRLRRHWHLIGPKILLMLLQRRAPLLPIKAKETLSSRLNRFFERKKTMIRRKLMTFLS